MISKVRIRGSVGSRWVIRVGNKHIQELRSVDAECSSVVSGHKYQYYTHDNAPITHYTPIPSHHVKVSSRSYFLPTTDYLTPPPLNPPKI